MNELLDDGRCYVCGKANPASLKVDFEIDREAKASRARFVPLPEHQGFVDIVHGGVLSTLLDEAMGKLAFCLGIQAVTAEMTVKFKTPVKPGEEIVVTGRITNEARRLVLAEAKIERGPVVVAEATGKLLKI